jgi:hypothetical protein
VGAYQGATPVNSGGSIFTPEGSLGGTSNKTSQDTVTLNSTITATAGQLIVVIAASDNEDTSDGETSLHASVTIDGNGATKAGEFTNAQGGASAGATVSIWYLIAPADIDAGSAAIVTHSTGKDAKAVAAYVFDWDTTFTLSLDGLATRADDGADPGSASATGALDVPHLWIRAIALEEANNTVGTLTPTAGWSNIPGSGTQGGAANSNISIRGEFKVSSGVESGASDPTAVSADCASLLVGLAASLPAGAGIPDAGDVRDGVSFGDDLEGTLELPTEAQVEEGVGYGEDGTEFTGTLEVEGGGGGGGAVPIGFF